MLANDSLHTPPRELTDIFRVFHTLEQINIAIRFPLLHVKSVEIIDGRCYTWAWHALNESCTGRGVFSTVTILVYLKSPEMNRSKGKGGVVGKDFSILIALEIIFPINIIYIVFHNNTYFNYSKIFLGT